ncbi:MAG: hypothetical protein KGJ03_09270 [Betaproteobacteria bacterium]|nr:hypothetical protein [Betaproteobacteria bacterium]MDE1955899.1 hypothetical protein [Betaproteobacteria bacterium]MDE2153111.1 hypothetical protein [Betaproteobacteria bacterium]MDE2480422.1 hypothetical protein [Betaproteobacteria bacterium]
MPGKLPPPQANVDNVLPGLLEDIRKRREAQQGGAEAATGTGAEPAAGQAPRGAPVPAAAPPRPDELDALRAELRRVRRWAGLALALALALAIAWLSGWHP